jgi:hypothetical protein
MTSRGRAPDEGHEREKPMNRRTMGLAFVCSMWGAQAQAAETWTACVPVDVAAYQSRIHVRCAASVGGINFFAAPTQDAAHAARLLAVLTAAQIAGRTLNILFDPADQSGAAISCSVSDCRLIRAASFGR